MLKRTNASATFADALLSKFLERWYGHAMEKHRGDLTEESKLLLIGATKWHDEIYECSYECTCGARVSVERDATGAFVPRIHAIRRGPKNCSDTRGDHL